MKAKESIHCLLKPWVCLILGLLIVCLAQTSNPTIQIVSFWSLQDQFPNVDCMCRSIHRCGRVTELHVASCSSTAVINQQTHRVHIMETVIHCKCKDLHIYVSEQKLAIYIRVAGSEVCTCEILALHNPRIVQNSWFVQKDPRFKYSGQQRCYLTSLNADLSHILKLGWQHQAMSYWPVQSEKKARRNFTFDVFAMVTTLAILCNCVCRLIAMMMYMNEM